MFTGIIKDTARVLKQSKHQENLELVIEKPPDWNDLEIGESVATDGVCLTVSSLQETTYACLLMPETLDKTTFGKVVPETVNLERSLKLHERLSGNFVQGHIDEVGRIVDVSDKNGVILSIKFSSRNRNMLATKGAITINGVALTVVNLHDDNFSVALIPYTLEHTTLSLLKKGSLVNLEFDIVGKYIAQIIKNRSKSL